MTSRNNIRAGPTAEKCGSISLPIAENQGKPTLEGSYSVDAPSRNEFVHGAVHGWEEFPATAEWKVENGADDGPLRNVLRGQGTLTAKTVVVLNRARACLEPRCERVGIANQLGIGVRNQKRPRAGKPLLHCELERVIDASIGTLAGK